MTLVDIEMYFKDRSSNHLGKLQDQIKKTQILNDMAFENHILEIGECPPIITFISIHFQTPSITNSFIPVSPFQVLRTLAKILR